jgi:hypothetical protein
MDTDPKAYFYPECFSSKETFQDSMEHNPDKSFVFLSSADQLYKFGSVLKCLVDSGNIHNKFD